MHQIYTPGEIRQAVVAAQEAGLRVRDHVTTLGRHTVCPLAAAVLEYDAAPTWRLGRQWLDEAIAPGWDRLHFAFRDGFIDAVDSNEDIGDAYLEVTGDFEGPGGAYTAFLYALGYAIAEAAGVKGLGGRHDTEGDTDETD